MQHKEPVQKQLLNEHKPATFSTVTMKERNVKIKR